MLFSYFCPKLFILQKERRIHFQSLEFHLETVGLIFQIKPELIDLCEHLPSVNFTFN